MRIDEHALRATGRLRCYMLCRESYDAFRDAWFDLVSPAIEGVGRGIPEDSVVVRCFIGGTQSAVWCVHVYSETFSSVAENSAMQSRGYVRVKDGPGHERADLATREKRRAEWAEWEQVGLEVQQSESRQPTWRQRPSQL